MPLKFIQFVRIALLLSVAPAWAASVVLVDQGDYDPLAEFRNSNTATNGNPVNGTGSVQQVADNFMVLDSGMRVLQVNLWFGYQFGFVPLEEQTMVLRIMNDSGGTPGSVAYEAQVAFSPIATSDTNSLGRQIYEADIMLPVPFDPVAGVDYWLSPLGSDDSVTWAWQFQNSASGQRFRRFGELPVGSGWGMFDGDFAFELIGESIPEPSGLILMASFVMVICGRRSRGSARMQGR